MFADAASAAVVESESWVGKLECISVSTVLAQTWPCLSAETSSESVVFELQQKELHFWQSNVSFEYVFTLGQPPLGPSLVHLGWFPLRSLTAIALGYLLQQAYTIKGETRELKMSA